MDYNSELSMIIAEYLPAMSPTLMHPYDVLFILSYYSQKVHVTECAHFSIKFLSMTLYICYEKFMKIVKNIEKN